MELIFLVTLTAFVSNAEEVETVQSAEGVGVEELICLSFDSSVPDIN